MERPRVDHESGTIYGRGHPWVGAVVEALHRGLENGKLRLLTTKSHGDYPADWFTGEVGKRRYDIEGGDPRTPLTAAEAAERSATFMVTPNYPDINAFEALTRLPIVLPRGADVYTGDSLCVYHHAGHYPKEQLPTHIRVAGGIVTERMRGYTEIYSICNPAHTRPHGDYLGGN